MSSKVRFFGAVVLCRAPSSAAWLISTASTPSSGIAITAEDLLFIINVASTTRVSHLMRKIVPAGRLDTGILDPSGPGLFLLIAISWLKPWLGTLHGRGLLQNLSSLVLAKQKDPPRRSMSSIVNSWGCCVAPSWHISRACRFSWRYDSIQSMQSAFLPR